MIQDIHFYQCCTSSEIAAPEDFIASGLESDNINLENYGEVAFIINKTGEAGATHVGQIYVISQATAAEARASGTAVAALYKTVTEIDTEGDWTVLPAAGIAQPVATDQMVIVLVKAEDLDGTDTFVRLYIDETTGTHAQDGSVVAILGKPRFSEENMPSAKA